MEKICHQNHFQMAFSRYLTQQLADSVTTTFSSPVVKFEEKPEILTSDPLKKQRLPKFVSPLAVCHALSRKTHFNDWKLRGFFCFAFKFYPWGSFPLETIVELGLGGPFIEKEIMTYCR